MLAFGVVLLAYQACTIEGELCLKLADWLSFLMTPHFFKKKMLFQGRRLIPTNSSSFVMADLKTFWAMSSMSAVALLSAWQDAPLLVLIERYGNLFLSNLTLDIYFLNFLTLFSYRPFHFSPVQSWLSTVASSGLELLQSVIPLRTRFCFETI